MPGPAAEAIVRIRDADSKTGTWDLFFYNPGGCTIEEIDAVVRQVKEGNEFYEYPDLLEALKPLGLAEVKVVDTKEQW